MKNKRKLCVKNCVIKGTNTKTGEEEWFLNVASVVKTLGCTPAHAYNVLRGVKYCHTVFGWRLEWVDFDEVSVVQSETGIKVQKHEDSDCMSEAQYWQQVDNMMEKEATK